MAARTSYAAGALAALAVALTALVVSLNARPGERPPPARSPEPAPAAVLAQWDARRSAAWADGDPVALAALYTDASPAGARDVRMLRRYLDRGLRVEGLRMQRISVVVVRRGPDVVDLRVRDRVVDGTVVGPGVRVPLPRDRLTGHLVTLRRVGEVWRVDQVRAVSPELPR